MWWRLHCELSQFSKQAGPSVCVWHSLHKTEASSLTPCLTGAYRGLQVLMSAIMQVSDDDQWFSWLKGDDFLQLCDLFVDLPLLMIPITASLW